MAVKISWQLTGETGRNSLIFHSMSTLTEARAQSKEKQLVEIFAHFRSMNFALLSHRPFLLISPSRFSLPLSFSFSISFSFLSLSLSPQLYFHATYTLQSIPPSFDLHIHKEKHHTNGCASSAAVSPSLSSSDDRTSCTKQEKKNDIGIWSE